MTENNLYGKEYHFRWNNELDKAMVIYVQILNKDNIDAAAYEERTIYTNYKINQGQSIRLQEQLQHSFHAT